MKSIVSLAALLFTIGLTAPAVAQSATEYFRIAPLPVSVYAPTAVPMQSMTVCEARTICANNGAPIWCRVWGGGAGYSACTWRVWPGRAVECKGYIRGANGWMWQRYFFRCY
jgi:hypothetical protein